MFPFRCVLCQPACVETNLTIWNWSSNNCDRDAIPILSDTHTNQFILPIAIWHFTNFTTNHLTSDSTVGSLAPNPAIWKGETPNLALQLMWNQGPQLGGRKVALRPHRPQCHTEPSDLPPRMIRWSDVMRWDDQNDQIYMVNFGILIACHEFTSFTCHIHPLSVPWSPKFLPLHDRAGPAHSPESAVACKNVDAVWNSSGKHAIVKRNKRWEQKWEMNRNKQK